MKRATVQTMIPGPLKLLTLEEFVEENNRLIRMGEARTRTFKDNRKNIWWYKLNTLHELNPEFSKSIGRIMLKKDE